jgi:hypothetical protein
MFTGLCVAAVNTFNKGNADVNGLMPVILVPVAGQLPNRNVLSGTVAANMGIEPGKTYLFQVREGEADPEYGRRFVFTKLQEMSALEILDASAKLGLGKIFSVDEPETPEGEEPTEKAQTKAKTIIE